MSDAQRTYNDRLAEAREVALGTPDDPSGAKQETLRAMYAAYAQMLVDLKADADADRITEERRAELQQAIGRRLQQLGERLETAVRTGQRDVIDAAVTAHQEATAAASDAAGVTIDVGEQWADVPQRVIRYQLQRRGIAGAETLQTIIRRNLQSVASDIDDAITSAIGRGVSWQRLTDDLAAQMAREDPALQQILRSMGRAAEDAAVGSGTEVLDEEDLKRAKRLLYDARRIAVSEINSTYDEADKISAQESPVVDLLRWRTSRRHDSLSSSPDVCDVLERADPHGYGDGLYHPATVPSLPHPHCMCRVESVLKPVEEWGTEPRPVPEKPEVDEDDLRSIMDAAPGDRSITDAHVAAQTRMLQRGIDALYDRPRTSN